MKVQNSRFNLGDTFWDNLEREKVQNAWEGYTCIGKITRGRNLSDVLRCTYATNDTQQD